MYFQQYFEQRLVGCTKNSISTENAGDILGIETGFPSFHHHREQRLVDAATPLQQGGEKRPSAQFVNLQIELICGRGLHSGTATVAVGGALVGAFEQPGADEGGRFGIDQLLIERLGGNPDSIGDIGEFELGEKVSTR